MVARLLALTLACVAAVLPTGHAGDMAVGGFLRKTLFSDGRAREYLLRFPTGMIDATATSQQSVVFALHCFGCDSSAVRAAPPTYPATAGCHDLLVRRCNTSGRIRRSMASPSSSPRATETHSAPNLASAAEKRWRKTWTMSASSSASRPACVRVCEHACMHGHDSAESATCLATHSCTCCS